MTGCCHWQVLSFKGIWRNDERRLPFSAKRLISLFDFSRPEHNTW